MRIFRRDWAVTVGTLRIPRPMRVSFDIERTLRSAPNKAVIKIWNLTRDHQAQIEQAAIAQVVLDAGFLEDRGAETLFSGELFRARGQGATVIGSQITPVDVVTTIEARDGGASYQRARVQRSFEPGVSVRTVVRAIADAMSVGDGNVDELLNIARLEAGGESYPTTYPEGTVLTGQASRELTRILAGLGLRWSVQHGNLQILRRGDALQTQVVRLTPDSGLIGSPQVGTRGRVNATARLSSDLWPGRRVELDSRRVRGSFRIRSAHYKGDSHGNEWDAELELEPVGAAA